MRAQRAAVWSLVTVMEEGALTGTASKRLDVRAAATAPISYPYPFLSSVCKVSVNPRSLNAGATQIVVEVRAAHLGSVCRSPPPSVSLIQTALTGKFVRADRADDPDFTLFLVGVDALIEPLSPSPVLRRRDRSIPSPFN